MSNQTNCINCGAPLTGNKCEYCGTSYIRTKNGLTAVFGNEKVFGTLEFNGKEYQVYISQIEERIVNNIMPHRDVSGRVAHEVPIRKKIFTVKEM